MVSSVAVIVAAIAVVAVVIVAAVVVIVAVVAVVIVAVADVVNVVVIVLCLFSPLTSVKENGILASRMEMLVKHQENSMKKMSKLSGQKNNMI